MTDKKDIANPDRMITPEVSVFGTRAPRPTGVGKHLIIVIILGIVAVAAAIIFAERDIPQEASHKVKQERSKK